MTDLSPRSFDRVSDSIKSNPDAAATYVAAKYGRPKVENGLDLSNYFMRFLNLIRK